jgi:hypothetical protein
MANKLAPSTLSAVTTYVASRPKACLRQLFTGAQKAAVAVEPNVDTFEVEMALVDLRPQCGYACDGDEGPNPDGSYGCPMTFKPVGPLVQLVAQFSVMFLRNLLG